MPIPINNAAIANARVLNGPFTGTPLTICKTPPEGTKGVSIQLSFPASAVSNAYLIDLSGGTSPAISQACSLWVDARNCANDISILFPDTGYSVSVNQFSAGLVPVLTSLASPKFYVINNGLILNNTDKCNIIVLNQFIPELNQNNFNSSINFGIGRQLVEEEFISRWFSSANKLAITTTAKQDLLSIGDAWVINGLQIYADITATGPQLYEIIIKGTTLLGDNMFQLPFLASATRQLIPLLNVSGLAARADRTYGTTALTIELNTITNLSTLNLYVNMQYQFVQ